MPSPNLKLPGGGGTYITRTRFQSDVTGRYLPRHCGFSRSEKGKVAHESLSAITEQAIWRYVVTGTCIWTMGERREVVAPGTVIATRQPSGGRLLFPDAPLETIWITVQGAPALDYFDQITKRFGSIHSLPQTSAPVRLAEELVRLARQNRLRDPFFWSDRTYLWLSTWHRYLEKRRIPLLPMLQSKPADSRKLLSAMRSVKSFAAQVGYSQSHLTRLLGRSWRETPGKVFQRVRMEDGARMLRDTTDLVGTIAGKVGYSSVPAFITAFKRKFGFTPAAYRRRGR